MLTRISSISTMLANSISAMRRTSRRVTTRWGTDSLTRLFTASSVRAHENGHSHQSYATPPTPTQPPNDPTQLLKSLDLLGGKHALLGRWLAGVIVEEGVEGKSKSTNDKNENNELYVHPSLEARKVSGAGVGLFASATIYPGEVLLRVPKSVFWSLGASHAEKQARKKVPQFVTHLERQCDSLGAKRFATHALFALHLLFELGDEGSKYRLYLASLPTLRGIDKSDGSDSSELEGAVPLLYAPSQLATLRGTPTFHAVAKRRAFVKDAHSAIFGNANGEQMIPLDQFQWALSTILSRATSGVNAPYALLPGIDLLNHAGVNANCELHSKRDESHSSQGDSDFLFVEATAKRYVQPDTQLTISYGDDLDNDKLLRVYGFCVPNNSNDRREVFLNVKGAALEAWKAYEKFGPGVHLARNAILRKHGLPRLADIDDMGKESEEAAKQFRQTVEKALGGGVAFRDPGDFQSALGLGEDEGDGDTKKENTTPFPSYFDDVDLSDDMSDMSDTSDMKSDKNSVIWSCYVAHPSKPSYPSEPTKPMDSASDDAARASDSATAAARGIGGGAVSAQALLASVRVHLLTGSEPPGSDGHEPNPWAPVSEMNEAATRAVVGEAAYDALRTHTESLRPNISDLKTHDTLFAQTENNPQNDCGHDHGHGGTDSNDNVNQSHAHSHSHGAPSSTPTEHDPDSPFAEASFDTSKPLSQKAAMDARLDLAGGSAWARNSLALRRGQEEILEHLLGQSSI